MRVTVGEVVKEARSFDRRGIAPLRRPIRRNVGCYGREHGLDALKCSILDRCAACVGVADAYVPLANAT